MSDVLALVRMRAEHVSANDFGHPWSLAFDNRAGYFHIIERGTAWVIVKGQEPLRLEAGDLAILPLGEGHILTTDPALDAKPIACAVTDDFIREAGINRLAGAGETTHLVCGRFRFLGVLAPKLLTVLPPLIHIRPDPGRPLEWLRLLSHFLVEEARTPKPGSAIMIERLLEVLFVQAIRAWAARGAKNLGWLSGLSDPLIGKALAEIHADPARPWTVEALARVAGLSRSAFAARFTDTVGQTPLKYLSGWRLNLAADHLRVGSTRIGEIAAQIGYGSEAALTRAFKVHFGSTPAAFRRSPHPLSPAREPD